MADEDLRRLAGEFLANHSEFENPSALFKELRERCPVADLGGMHLVTRFKDVGDLYRTPQFSRQQQAIAEVRAHSSGDDDEILDQARRATTSMLINLDEPDHKRVRQILEVAFRPERVASWGPRIEAITDGLIDRVAGEPQFNLLQALAYPLPERVICELVGVPYEDHALWSSWTETIVGAARTYEPPPEQVAAVEAAYRNFYLYFRDLVADRRRNLGDDLVSVLLRAESENMRLSELEVSGTLQLLIEAGHETTANLITNGMLALLDNPDQYRKLREDPALVPSAVEEMLRFLSPAHLTLPRQALGDVALAGVEVPKGAVVVGNLQSANRDPSVFDDPDKFDICRGMTQHMAFGAGPHFCLGNRFARLEARAMFDRIVRRLPELELVRRPKWKPTFTRSLDELVVRAA